MNLYAHSLPGEPVEKWQALESHSQNVAKKAFEFAEEFGSGDWAWNAGSLHDLGKADDGFQGYLLRENDMDDSEYDGAGKVNHSSAGAAFSEKTYNHPIGRTLAYLIAGHHAGLPDWFPSETGNAALQIRLQEGNDNLARISSYAESLKLNLRTLSRPPSFVKSSNYHFWVRMLFSSLVDADYLDTEEFMNRKNSTLRFQTYSLHVLEQKLSDALGKMERDAPKSKVNEIRSQIRKACVEKAKSSPGLFSLTVPTGGGKTLSAMIFALKHAILYEKKRIIYVIPYTSIIEQTAQTLRFILGDENVLEHHSNLDPEKETQRSRLAAENWDAPVIVTTNVQFFESLYAAKSSRCRKLHSIVNSVIILDEAQLLPPEKLMPCVSAISELTQNYGVTVVLSTATQPALPGLVPTEIIPSEWNLYDQLRRVEVSLPSDFHQSVTWDELVCELERHNQVLCIVNTRRDCHELFQKMSQGTLHLSALMCGEHRSEIIRDIKDRLKKGETLRVISTQLVEAGVDIDFPVVFRALAGLDSIAQAAGRCNREGKESLGKVTVFVPPSSAPRGLLRKGEDAMKAFIHQKKDPLAPESYPDYFTSFYSRMNENGDHWLQDRLIKDVPNIHFRTAGKEFQLIDDQASRPVFVRYKESPLLLTELQKIGPHRILMRKLQRFTVNISKYQFDTMLMDGRLEKVREDFYAQGMIKYDPLFGLDIFSERFAPDDLIT